MQCPLCSKTMKPGTVKMAMSGGGTAMALFGSFFGAGGGGGEHLYFYPEDGGDRSCVVDRFDSLKQALHCPSCKLLLIPNQSISSMSNK
ncbi:MAG TPA: PF20097 family protein [Gemmatales bacterium]|nr:PF20097 family protein [Gemmatales bacterium]